MTSMQEITWLNNLRVADIRSIGAMKMETMSRRSKFRDYYDIYSILKEGIDFSEMVSIAISHSNRTLKEKNLIGMLANGERFKEDLSFKNLNPQYSVTANDIQRYISYEIEKKSLQDSIKRIDSTLRSTAVMFKGKDGQMMLRVTLDDAVLSIELTPEEVAKIRETQKQLPTLAVEKFHQQALDYLIAKQEKILHP